MPPSTNSQTENLARQGPSGRPLDSRSRRLGRLLVDRGAVTPGQLCVALAKQEGNPGYLGDILLEQGALDQETLARLDAATAPLKALFGTNPDMWQSGANSRYR